MSEMDYIEYLKVFEAICTTCGVSVWFSSQGICDECGTHIRRNI